MRLSSHTTRCTAGTIDVFVIGAGHAGLAISRILNSRGIEHIVLERGEVANSWRKERWDSLKLLTPNWQTRMPGCAYDGDVRNGFDGITVNYTIDADASEEDIAAVVAQSQKRSAVFDIITNPTNITVRVNQ